MYFLIETETREDETTVDFTMEADDITGLSKGTIYPTLAAAKKVAKSLVNDTNCFEKKILIATVIGKVVPKAVYREVDDE